MKEHFHHVRAELESRIEELITLLDVLDDDPDLEDGNDDEPSLAGYTAVNARLEHDLESDTSDDEPSCGWTHYEATTGDYAPTDQNSGEEENGGDTEPNGDEADFTGYEGELDLSGGRCFDGSGTALAESLLRGLPSATQRAQAYIDAGPLPILYDGRRARTW
jgi:hypothetical protein